MYGQYARLVAGAEPGNKLRGAKYIGFKEFVAYIVIRPKSKYYIILKYLTSYTSKIKITYLVTIFHFETSYFENAE